MLVACTPAKIDVPVTPSVPLNVAEVAFSIPNVLVPVTPSVPDATMLVACTPAKIDVPPTYKLPPIPTPPATANAPDDVPVDTVVDGILTITLLVLP